MRKFECNECGTQRCVVETFESTAWSVLPCHGDFMGSHFVCDVGNAQKFVGIAGCCEKYERL